METQNLINNEEVTNPKKKFYWVKFEGRWNLNSAYPAAVGIYRKRMTTGVIQGQHPFEFEKKLRDSDPAFWQSLSDFKEISEQEFLLYLEGANAQGQLDCLKIIY